jgi:putative oxidoreductase
MSDVPDLPAQVDAGLLLLRVLVGVTFSLHGFQKLFGWFGGGGFEGTSRWFASLGFGDGRAATAMAGGTEIAGLGLAVGLLTPLAAAGMIGVMTVAGPANRAEGGFWSASKGWELNGYLVVVAWALATTGPGAYSLDALLGSPVPSGVLPGLLALAAGFGLGWLRWATRSD